MNGIEWVGIPYNRRGWTREEGMFCWSLVKLVAKEVFGKEVPKIEYDARKLVESKGVGGLDFIANQEPVHLEETQAGDYLQMRTMSDRGRLTETHIGIFMSPTHVLHLDNDRDKSMIESVNSDNFSWRIVQAWREKE